jgi:hypothetical protein
MRRICGAIAPASILLVWATAALAADAANWFPDDIALTKATISLLVARDNATVRDRLDPAAGQVSDDTLRQMADVIGTSEPISIETISETGGHNIKTGDGNSRMILEYTLPGPKWAVVDAVVRTQTGSKRFTRLVLTANALPLREVNAFYLFGKGVTQYLFLAAWIATILLTVWAIIVAFRRHTGWRKWALIALMPLGLTPTLAVNWNTGQMWVLEAGINSAVTFIPVVAFRYPMALFSRTEVLAPFLYISAPLIALGYLIWQFVWSKKTITATSPDT